MATPVAWTDATTFNVGNIRKALGGAFFIKPYDKADTVITQIWTTAAGFIIPTGYKHVGLVTQKDGYQFTRDTDTAEVDSHGQAEPTRIDITKDQISLKVIMQETKALTLGIYEGQDLSSIKADANNNVVYDKPSKPQLMTYRGLVVGTDGDGPGMIVNARWLPMIRVTKLEDETWGSEDEDKLGVTFSGFTDPLFKTACRRIIAGPGFDPVGAGFLANS